LLAKKSITLSYVSSVTPCTEIFVISSASLNAACSASERKPVSYLALNVNERCSGSQVIESAL
jgi:hypothetical protein